MPTPRSAPAPNTTRVRGQKRRRPTGKNQSPGHSLRLHYACPSVAAMGAHLHVWCWEAFPREQDLPAMRVDEFGVVFELPRHSLRPRGRMGFRFKVGPGLQVTWLDFDRFWSRKWGWEVWINQGDPTLYRSRAAASRPQLHGAYLNDSDTLEVFTNPRHVPLTNPAQWDIDGGKVLSVQEVTPTLLRLQTTPLHPSSCAEVRLNTTHGKVVIGITPQQVFEAPPSGLPLGALPSDGLTTFRVFAPRANQATLQLHRDHVGPAVRGVPMHRVEGGIWEVHIAGNLQGAWYTYHVDGPKGAGEAFDAHRPLLDPWAAVAVTSGEKHTGRAMVMDLGKVAVKPLAHRRPLNELVIYEVHVRDLMGHPSAGLGPYATERHTYKAWTRGGTRGPGGVKTGIDHLVELGVDAVQLLPVHEYPWPHDSHHWGYEPSAFFSPALAYASGPGEAQVREFAGLVQALHDRGIAVILDMVFNHTVEGDEKGPVLSFKGLDSKYWYRRSPRDFAYANGSGCGNELASERPMARRLIVDCCKHFVDHYKVDGFRFDLLALLDLETLAAIRAALPPDIYLYGEPWAASGAKWSKGALNTLPPWAVFNDNYRDAVKGSPEGPWKGFVQGEGSIDHLLSALTANTLSFGAAGAWASSPLGSINYVTCHDNLTLHDKLEVSVPGMSDHEKRQRVKLTALIQHLSLGPVFIAGGDEMLRSRTFRPGHDGRAQKDADSPALFDANAYRAPDGVTNFNWERKLRYADVFLTYSRLGALKRSELGRCLHLPHPPHPGFMEVFHTTSHDHAIGWGWNADLSYGDYHLRVFTNADRHRPALFRVNFAKERSWRNLGDLDSLTPSGLADINPGIRELRLPPLSALVCAGRRLPSA